jgi:hypothetical protein
MNDNWDLHMLITNYPVTLLWWLDFGHPDGKYRRLWTAVAHNEMYEWLYKVAGEEVAVVHFITYLHYKLINSHNTVKIQNPSQSFN